jgi:hypothetical protein
VVSGWCLGLRSGSPLGCSSLPLLRGGLFFCSGGRCLLRVAPLRVLLLRGGGFLVLGFCSWGGVLLRVLLLRVAPLRRGPPVLGGWVFLGGGACSGFLGFGGCFGAWGLLFACGLVLGGVAFLGGVLGVFWGLVLYSVHFGLRPPQSKSKNPLEKNILLFFWFFWFFWFWV